MSRVAATNHFLFLFLTFSDGRDVLLYYVVFFMASLPPPTTHPSTTAHANLRLAWAVVEGRVLEQSGLELRQMVFEETEMAVYL